MPWLGKMFGGLIGFTIGGPIGAIIGAALGHGVDTNSTDAQRRTFSAQQSNRQNTVLSGERLQSIFFATVFACAGKIAMADGEVSQVEKQALENYVRKNLRLGENALRFALRIFSEAARSGNSYDEFAHQFYNAFKGDRSIIMSMMELQFQIAMADGEFHPNEEKLLLRGKSIFHLSDAEYAHVRSYFIKDFVDDLASHYSILGCSKSDSMETIKSKYRKMVQEYHPDKVISKGLPEEFITFANKKFDEIQTAYEMIEKSRKSA